MTHPTPEIVARKIMQNAGKYQNENRLDQVILAALRETAEQARAEALEEAAKVVESWKRLEAPLSAYQVMQETADAIRSRIAKNDEEPQ